MMIDHRYGTAEHLDRQFIILLFIAIGSSNFQENTGIMPLLILTPNSCSLQCFYLLFSEILFVFVRVKTSA